MLAVTRSMHTGWHRATSPKGAGTTGPHTSWSRGRVADGASPAIASSESASSLVAARKEQEGLELRYAITCMSLT